MVEEAVLRIVIVGDVAAIPEFGEYQAEDRGDAIRWCGAAAALELDAGELAHDVQLVEVGLYVEAWVLRLR